MTRRFPIPRYPTGWFQIAWSHELEPGAVKPIVSFGKDLVLFRTEEGQASVLDAHCPHLGAHLGYGGAVEGNGIVCPFHAWKFDGQGECVDIPYAKKIPRKAEMDCWPVAEHSGIIMVWHDIDKNPPSWEVPEAPEFMSDEWSEPHYRQWKFRTHNQEMAENIVDSAHFKYLHGTVNYPDSKISEDGPIFYMDSPTTMTTPGGEVEGRVQAISHGFGFSTNRFTGLVETLVMGNVTPRDDEFVDVRFSFTVRKVGGADVTKGVGKAFVAEISRQLEQDRPVWENKIFFERPVLCDGDGPFMALRKWGRQFFPEWYREQSRAEYFNGLESGAEVREPKGAE